MRPLTATGLEMVVRAVRNKFSSPDASNLTEVGNKQKCPSSRTEFATGAALCFLLLVWQ